MPAVTNLFEHGPITYIASAAVSGGQLVSAVAGGTVAPSTTGDTAVLGVAVTDAQPSDAGATATTPYGADVVDASWPRAEVAVAYRGVYRLTAEAACAFGDLLVAGTLGQVTPVGVTPVAGDGRTIVGRCVDPDGIALGARGKVQLGTAGAA